MTAPKQDTSARLGGAARSSLGLELGGGALWSGAPHLKREVFTASRQAARAHAALLRVLLEPAPQQENSSPQDLTGGPSGALTGALPPCHRLSHAAAQSTPLALSVSLTLAGCAMQVREGQSG